MDGPHTDPGPDGSYLVFRTDDEDCRVISDSTTTVGRMRPDTASPEPLAARGAVAIIANRRGELLLHLRDDFNFIAWPDHWSLLGGGADGEETPAAAIVRELDEEAGLAVVDLVELFDIRDVHGSGQIITFFSGHWDGDESLLPLAEGVKLQFFEPEHLDILTIPPFIQDGINRYLATQHV